MTSRASERPGLAPLGCAASHGSLLAAVAQTLDFATGVIGRVEALMQDWPIDHERRAETLDKVVSESALLLLIASRATAHLGNEGSRTTLIENTCKLREALAPHVRGERASVLLLRSPRYAVRFGVPHVALTLAGAPDPTFDAYLEEALRDDRGSGTTEQIPFRILEERWLKSLTDGGTVECEDLLPISIFSGNVHPIYMDRMDVYAATHWLMYLSDFGKADPSHRIDQQRVGAILDAAIAWNLVTEDFDLLGELLMATSMLRRPWSPHCVAAWSVLSAAFDDLGFVPSPSFDPSAFEARGDSERGSYAVAHIYHTQYVFGMLCAMLLLHPEGGTSTPRPHQPQSCDVDVVGRCIDAVNRAQQFCGYQDRGGPSAARPSVTAAGAPVNGGAEAFDLLAALAAKNRDGAGADHVERTPFWCSILERDPATKTAAVPVLLDAVLIKAAREYDLDTLVKALSITMLVAVPPSDTFKEALLFLCRQQTPPGAIGAHFVREDNLDAPAAKIVTKGIAQTLAWAADYLATDLGAHLGTTP